MDIPWIASLRIPLVCIHLQRALRKPTLDYASCRSSNSWRPIKQPYISRVHLCLARVHCKTQAASQLMAISMELCNSYEDYIPLSYILAAPSSFLCTLL